MIPGARDHRGQALAPALPTARGTLSAAIIKALQFGDAVAIDSIDADPYGEDLQLALLVCYELHYRGFFGVDDRREWDPELLRVRNELEQSLEQALRADHHDGFSVNRAMKALDELAIENIDAGGASYHLRDAGTWAQYREYFALRSIYQLKEADPHAWAIPRLVGATKAALVAVEFDEYGAGHGANVHQDLFARLMRAAGMRDDYLGYLDEAPAEAMLSSNVASMLGLHRAHRGAIVGHLAATEITSSPGARRLLAGLERLDAPPTCRVFYREHVEADAVHEQIMRLDVVGELLAQEPHLDADVAFGVTCFTIVEKKIDEYLLASWL